MGPGWTTVIEDPDESFKVKYGFAKFDIAISWETIPAGGLQKHTSVFGFLYDIRKCPIQQDKPSSFFITAKPCNKHQERSA